MPLPTGNASWYRRWLRVLRHPRVLERIDDLEYRARSWPRRQQVIFYLLFYLAWAVIILGSIAILLWINSKPA